MSGTTIRVFGHIEMEGVSEFAMSNLFYYDKELIFADECVQKNTEKPAD